MQVQVCIYKSGDQPKLMDVFRKLLPLAARWRNIGALLGISNDILRAIRYDERESDNCLREMLSVWLKNTNPLPTWEILAGAVEHYDPAKAQEIRDCIAR